MQTWLVDHGAVRGAPSVREIRKGRPRPASAVIPALVFTALRHGAKIPQKIFVPSHLPMVTFQGSESDKNIYMCVFKLSSYIHAFSVSENCQIGN